MSSGRAIEHSSQQSHRDSRPVIRIGTRGSALAVAQTEQVATRLAAASDARIELVRVTTYGDTSRESLATIGGTGVFASALRDALLADECDVVVHSLKDLPTGQHPGLRIAAVPRRADPRDALCARDGLELATLPDAARVGTGSPRRRAQLLSRRPDLDVRDLRGNVESRLDRVIDGELDAVLLAAAGLGRLGRIAMITDFLGLDRWPSAPGQGALALETRDEPLAPGLAKAVHAVDHPLSRATTEAERLVLAGLEAGCSAPIAASAFLEDDLFFLTATVYSADGGRRVTSAHAASPESRTASHLIDAAHDVAERVVTELIGNGAAELIP